MHEESLTRSLLRQVEELAVLHQAVRIEEIVVEVGPLSGVEPLLLQSAFERLRRTTRCSDSILSIQHVGLDILCDCCHTESGLKDFHFVCPECGSTSLRILRGDEFRLLNVRLQINDFDDAAMTASDGPGSGSGPGGLKCKQLL